MIARWPNRALDQSSVRSDVTIKCRPPSSFECDDLRHRDERQMFLNRSGNLRIAATLRVHQAVVGHRVGVPGETRLGQSGTGGKVDPHDSKSPRVAVRPFKNGKTNTTTP